VTQAKVYIFKSDRQLSSDASRQLFPKAYFQETGKTIVYEKLLRGKFGKPEPIDELFFNISHSSHYFAVIFSTEECGIDIEEPRDFKSNISKRVLSKDEPIIGDNLLNNWVIKEAYVKYLGIGLNKDFRDVSAKELLETEHIYNLSTNGYYCYAATKSPTEISISRQ
jgi:4'-phosphopantetheinyl transferase